MSCYCLVTFSPVTVTASHHAMPASFLLAPERILLDIPASCKTDLLRSAAALVEERLFFRREIVFQALSERERLSSTGLGSGIAVPHARLTGLVEPVGAFLRLAKPVEFQAVDDAPVDLVFLLLAPPASDYANAMHLQALASVSRTLRDKVMRARLRACRTPLEVMNVFAGTPAEPVIAPVVAVA
jgi:nitrogen PTS system EIIA component